MQRDFVDEDNLCEKIAEAIFLRLIGKPDSHFEIAQKVAQYLDSKPELEKTITLEITVPISLPPNTKNGFCKSIIDEIQEKLAQNFGGYTRIEAVGGWYDENKNLVEEPSRIIRAGLQISAWVYVTDILESIIQNIQQKLMQKCVYVTVHNLSYPVNLVDNTSEFPDQEKFLGVDPEVVRSGENTMPNKPKNIHEEHSKVADDVESAAELSSSLAQPFSMRAAEIRRIKPKLKMFWIFMVFFSGSFLILIKI